MKGKCLWTTVNSKRSLIDCGVVFVSLFLRCSLRQHTLANFKFQNQANFKFQNQARKQTKIAYAQPAFNLLNRNTKVEPERYVLRP